MSVGRVCGTGSVPWKTTHKSLWSKHVKAKDGKKKPVFTMFATCVKASGVAIFFSMQTHAIWLFSFTQESSSSLRDWGDAWDGSIDHHETWTAFTRLNVEHLVALWKVDCGVWRDVGVGLWYCFGVTCGVGHGCCWGLCSGWGIGTLCGVWMGCGMWTVGYGGILV